MNFKICWALALVLCACAVDKKGILLDVEPATPLDDRDFQKHCDLGDRAACALSHSDSASLPVTTIPLVQGIAPSDRAVFAALIPKNAVFSWFLYDREQNQLWKLNTARIQTRSGSNFAVQRIEARGLEPKHEYELLASDHEGRLLEDRSFQTLHAAEDSLRIALVSGLKNGGRDADDRLMASVSGKKPSLIVFAGGNVDVTLPPELAKAKPSAVLDYFFHRYAQTRNIQSFARARTLLPIAATWNEAEFGHAKGDRTFPFRDQAREAFEIFFPQWADETTIVNGPGVSKAVQLGGQIIALLDNRSFRAPDPRPLPPICEKTKRKKKVCKAAPPIAPAPGSRFGSLQTEWLKRQSQKAARPLSLFSGDPWFGPFSENWSEQVIAASADLAPLVSGGFAILDSSRNAPLSVREIVPANSR